LNLFQKIQYVSARGDSESIEVVGDVEHISEAEIQSDQICPKRVHRSTAWLQDYETSYAYIAEQGELSPYQKAWQSIDLRVDRNST
jgi:hypothetical protein